MPELTEKEPSKGATGKPEMALKEAGVAVTQSEIVGSEIAGAEMVDVVPGKIESRGIKALKMGIFAAVFAAAGFMAGLGVNVKKVAGEYLKEADGDWKVIALLNVMSDIDKQCRESHEKMEEILKRLDHLEK